MNLLDTMFVYPMNEHMIRMFQVDLGRTKEAFFSSKHRVGKYVLLLKIARIRYNIAQLNREMGIQERIL